MTITLDPRRPRQDFPALRRRSPRISTGQVYYGEKLRRVLAPEPTDPLFIDRVADYYCEHKWPAVVLLILGAMFLAACIVFIVGCSSIIGCQPGESRCKGNTVEECHSLSGWERQTVCAVPEACVFDSAASCGTYEVACCASVAQ